MSLTMAELAPRTHMHDGRVALVARYGPGLYADLSGGLGDHIRVGPQYMPAAVRGTPIVQRGPHGMRFAPIPSESDTTPRAWSEQLYNPGEWTPHQSTPGVMGFRGLGAVDAGSLNNFNAVTEQAQAYVKSGNLVAAQRSVDYARQLLANFPADDQGTYQPVIDNLQSFIGSPAAAQQFRDQSAAIDQNIAANPQRVAAQFDAAHANDGDPCTLANGRPGKRFGGTCVPQSDCGFLPQSICDAWAKLQTIGKVAATAGALYVGYRVYTATAPLAAAYLNSKAPKRNPRRRKGSY